MKKYVCLIWGIFFSLVSYSQIDGPYIFHEGKSLRMIGTDHEGNINDTLIKKPSKNYLFTVHTQDGKQSFDVKLHPVTRPAWKTKQADKLFITSDPHGNFNYFSTILKAGGVIDANFRWSFGKNHLVVIGDIFDRGGDVLPIFWLVYQLEQEASEAGGQVSFLLGNHEELVMRNDVRYTKESYKNLAQKLAIPYNALWTENTELGYWLKNRNTMQVIGDNLFVHAGLSMDFLAKNLSIPVVNDTISHYLLHPKEKRNQSELAKFLFSTDGPLWYRGMVRTEESNHPIDKTEFNLILQKYGVNRIFVGHTIFTEITGFFGDKLIDVNVDNEENSEKKRGRALLIENNQIYLIYDSGKRIIRF
ncbi:hypothetical protein FACS189426_17720 [Bacteroidia bacterium]|nr:hypothetical protein FACS189426_17720 [Bacteroidia bacterium]